MNSAATHLASLLKRPSSALQQWRGIRVKVMNGNLEQALTFMQRKMRSSGIERLINTEQTHHIKNSEKRILARKALQRKIQSQDLARKLKSILIRKVRYVMLNLSEFRSFNVEFGVYCDGLGCLDVILLTGCVES